MKNSIIRLTWIALSALIWISNEAAFGAALPLEKYNQKPKLVVVIVVDQFRADYLTRFQSRFLPAKQGDGSIGGYRYLMSTGAYFPFAQYDVFQCMTGPGHSMILSGTYPYRGGIPINYFYSHDTQKPSYCVEDPSQPVVGGDPNSSKKQAGYSPKNLLATTLGDELKNAGHPSKVVTVSLKDRAAILMGGHRADLALWFDPSSYRFVTSRFYLKANEGLPQWMQDLNQTIAEKKGQTYEWKPLGKPSGMSLPATGEFLRKTQIGSKEALASPYGLELTELAAERALAANQLGKGKGPDLLAVSFSSHDYLGHQMGPNTLEMEEMTVAEDHLISKLLNKVRTQVPGGMRDVVVVFTADHGIPPSPSWLSTVKVDAGHINTEALSAEVEKALEQKFGKPEGGKWLIGVSDFNFYLSQKAIVSAKISSEQAENVVRALLEAHPAAFKVFTRTDYFNRKLPVGLLERQIQHGYFPGRSGDVVLIPKPYYIMDDDTDDHISGFAYDRTVPVIFSGMHFKSGVYSSAADVVDIAPTLSFILGVVAPSMSEGKVLTEAISP